MKKSLLIPIIWTTVFLLSALAVEDETIIPADPTVVRGTLENGLDWYVRPNDLPEQRAELRLVVSAGSILEREDQRGLAHFLEHMAFNGTESYPQNELVEYLQSLGMGFGPDINASTSFDETIYKLTVNTASEGELEKALAVLSEWAFRINITEEEVEKEKPVILEERRMGRDATGRMREKSFPIIFHDSSYGERLPIGTEEVIRNATAESLREFYLDWYRPELMSVIVTGDVDTEEVVRLIESHFSEGENRPDSPLREEYPVPDHSGPLFSLQSDEEATLSSLEVINKYEPAVTDTPEGWDRYFREQLFLIMFNNRISELLGQPSPPFINGYAGSAATSRAKHLFQWGVMTNPGELRRGFRALWTEVERVRRYGFTPAELDRAGRQMMSGYDYMIEEKLSSATWASIIVSSLTTGDGLTTLEWERDRLASLLSSVTPDEIRSEGDKWFSSRSRVISFMGPEAPTEEQVLQVMIQVEESELSPYEDGKMFTSLMEKLPEPGSVVKKEYREDLDMQVWTLSNGLEVYLKKTDYRENEILFKGISPGGASLLPDQDMISAALAGTAVGQSGLGWLSTTELEQFLADKNVSLSPSVGDYWESLSGFSTPDDLEYLMQLIHLYFSAPLYRPEGWDAYRDRLADYLKNQEKDPMEQYSRVLNETVYMGHPRVRMLTFESLEEMDYDRAYGIFRERFFDGDDFRFFFVGNFDEERMEELLSLYGASLISVEGSENWEDRGVRYNQSPMERTVEAGIEEQGFVSLIISGPFDWSYEEAYILSALGDCVENRLLEILREKEGGSYSVNVSARSHNIPAGEYNFTVQFSCDPARTEELTDLVIGELEGMRGTTDLTDYARDTAEAKRRSFEENLQKNGWYLYNLSFLISRGLDPNLFLKGEELSGTITAETMGEAALNYLDTERIQAVILHPNEENTP
ncbi:MAG: insulinase family protein [Spirochaetales bacterium]|nr:insulinase family protein [Spirochaetales bacterium]